jgi:hypothetical protein
MQLTWCGSRPIVCAFTVSVAAVALEAQSPRFTVGPGVSIPTGGYGNHDNEGWHVLGAAVVPSPVANLLFRFDGMYSVTTHQGSDNGHTRIAGAGASLLWRLRREGPNLRPYLLMGIGFYDVMTTSAAVYCYSAYCSGSTSQTALAWSGGGGVDVQVGPAMGFLEARYVTIRTSGTPTNLFPVTLGFVFGAR